MELLLRIVLINTATASLLAIAVALIGLTVRRPSVMHALWLVVLLKLFTPPLVEVETLPIGWFSPGGETSAVETVPATTPVVASPAPPTPAPRRLSLSTIGIGIWFSGAASIFLLALSRTRRFQRFVRDSPEAPRWLRRRASTIARRIGLARAPRIRLTAGRVSPMLWHGPGGSVLLLPQELLQRLEPSECDAVLAHELAHLHRRDHWVRWIEFAAGTLFWWHPLVWWTRRQLRIAEEKSCDAMVLRALPGQAGAYAEGLLKTLEYLAGRKSCTPALATGADETRHLSERLTMILNERLPRPTPVMLRWLIGSLALTALLVFPTWADRTEDKQESPAREATHRAELIELRRQAVEVEKRLERLALRQVELKRTMQEEMIGEESDTVEARVKHELQQRLAEMELAQAQADARTAEEAARHALELGRELASVQRRAELMQREQQERDRERAIRQQERALRHLRSIQERELLMQKRDELLQHDEAAAARELEARIGALDAVARREEARALRDDRRADDLQRVREELVHQIETLEESSETEDHEELKLLRAELRKLDAALERMR